MFGDGSVSSSVHVFPIRNGRPYNFKKWTWFVRFRLYVEPVFIGGYIEFSWDHKRFQFSGISPLIRMSRTSPWAHTLPSPTPKCSTNLTPRKTYVKLKSTSSRTTSTPTKIKISSSQNHKTGPTINPTTRPPNFWKSRSNPISHPSQPKLHLQRTKTSFKCLILEAYPKMEYRNRRCISNRMWLNSVTAFKTHWSLT